MEGGAGGARGGGAGCRVRVKMCTGLLATGEGGGAVLAFNRDEDFVRPTAAAEWREGVLAGWDQRGGGTWLGVSRSGRLACLTNVRQVPAPAAAAGAPSRGGLPLLYLRQGGAPTEFLQGLVVRGLGGCALETLSGFNLLCCDLSTGESALLSNRGPLAGHPQALAPGSVHGMSNGTPGTPEWAKVARGRRKLGAALAPGGVAGTLVEVGFGSQAGKPPGDGPLVAVLRDVLACREKAASQEDLPATGMAAEVEMAMSSIFVEDDPDMCRRNLRCEHYGTRCSTVVAVSPEGTVTFLELRREPDGTWAQERFDFCIEPQPRPGS